MRLMVLLKSYKSTHLLQFEIVMFIVQSCGKSFSSLPWIRKTPFNMSVTQSLH